MIFVLTLIALIGSSVADYESYYSCTCYEYRIFCSLPEELPAGSDWSEANAYCGTLGGTLATIDSEDTWNGIRGNIRPEWKENGCNWGFWIGFKDMRPHPHLPSHKTNPQFFSWVTPMCTYYENWAESQPNDNRSESEHGQLCVQLWYRPGHKGKYDDEYCYENKGFVCQIPYNCNCP
ncbi:salivary C-type lectin 2-like [Saccoglossus kowalevskii]